MSAPTHEEPLAFERIVFFSDLVARGLGRGMARKVAALLLLVPVLAAARSAPTQDGVDQLRFMTWCWERRTSRGTVEERWSTPKGGMLQGMGRTFRGDSLVESEYVIIREVAGRAVYEAHPSGQAPNIFPVKTISDTLVEFEDPTHDYPQRVGYRRAGTDSLIAWIDGTTPRGPRHVDFPYVRIRCE
jgi:uncharacterized protein DUF6265